MNPFTDRLRLMHIDLHCPEFWAEALTKFDVHEMLALLEGAGANAAGFPAVCSYGNAYYPTRIGHPHRGLSGDPLGEFIEGSHKRRIKVYGYINAVLNYNAGRENPDWTMKDSAGNPIYVGRIPPVPGLFLCPNSPYRDEYFYPILREIIAGYPVDGMFLDRGSISAFGEGFLCYCRYCREGFRAEFGVDPPVSAAEPFWREFVGWRQGVVGEFLFGARRVIRGIRPDAAVIFNGGFDVLLEPTAEPGRLPDMMHFDCGTHPLVLGLRARYWSGFGVPYMVHITRWHDYWQDWGTLKSADCLSQEASVLLAGGGIPSLADHPYPDGSLSPAVYETAKMVFDFVREREAYCVGTESVPHLAVLRSAATYGAALARAGDPKALSQSIRPGEIEGNTEVVFHHTKTVQGAHKCLAQAGVHFDLLNEKFLLPRIADYGIVLLPNQAALDRDTVDALLGYVRAGGSIVATGVTSLMDASGQSLGNFALAEAFGVGYRGRSCYPNGFLDLRSLQLAEGLPNLLVGVKKVFSEVELCGAEELARLIVPPNAPSPARFFHSGVPPQKDSGFPAVTLNRYGKGIAVYVAAPVFADYWDTNFPDLRRLIKNMLRLAAGGRLPLELDGPSQVEATVRQSGGRTLVHLVNNYEEPRLSGPRAVETVLPVHGISFSLQLREKPTRVTIIPGGQDVAWDWQQSEINIRIEKLAIHSIIVVE